MGGNSYAYDANGNMSTRNLTDLFTFDAENRLAQVVTVGGLTLTSYSYDGDGARVKKAVGATSTFYIGNYYEVTDSGAITQYYYFGAQRIAMRTGAGIAYLHGDHPSTSLRACLGSTSVATDQCGALFSRQTYYAFGAPRTTDGSALPTDFGFTGQKACTERAPSRGSV